MSISSETSRNDYVGTGLVTTYSYGFRIFSETHLLLTQRTSADVVTTLVLNTDYTVAGVGDATGGTIVLAAALALDAELSIRRELPLTQSADIRNQSSFFPETHEDAFDKLVMIDQQQQDELNRSIKAPETEDALDDLPSADDRANTYLGFDSDGQPIAVAAAVGTTPVSAFILTLLDDISAAAARATLLIGSADIVYSAGKGPVIQTPDGLHTWRVVVDNDGNIGTEQVS